MKLADVEAILGALNNANARYLIGAVARGKDLVDVEELSKLMENRNR